MKPWLGTRAGMWPAENRGRYDRGPLGYPSDLIDQEWALVEPLIPPAKPGGKPASLNVREVVHAIMCSLATACPVAGSSEGPAAAQHGYLHLWSYDGKLDRIPSCALCAVPRARGRDASPAAALIGRHSVNPLGLATPINELDCSGGRLRADQLGGFGRSTAAASRLGPKRYGPTRRRPQA